MKHRRAPLPAAAAHQDDSTANFKAGTEPTMHRRTTVTVERETLSILMRRPVAGATREPQDGKTTPEPPGEMQSVTSPKLSDEASVGKP